MVDVLDREVERVLVALRVAAVLGSPVGEHPAKLHRLRVEDRHDPVVRARSAAVIGVLRSETLAKARFE